MDGIRHQERILLAAEAGRRVQQYAGYQRACLPAFLHPSIQCLNFFANEVIGFTVAHIGDGSLRFKGRHNLRQVDIGVGLLYAQQPDILRRCTLTRIAFC